MLCMAVSMGVWLAALGGLQGCSTLGGPGSAAAQKQATQDKLEESLADAEASLKQGKPEEALARLDAAARIDPAAKQPWLKKAQIHFEARQYGLAITQAQEVIQRDVNDLTARSILAVSGLRVSAEALEQLRKVNEVKGSTRSEAESVARLIHEALGEPILIAPPAAAPLAPEAPASRGRSPARSGQRAVTRAAPPVTGSAPVAPAAAIAPVSKPAPVVRTAPAAAGRNNPFGALQ